MLANERSLCFFGGGGDLVSVWDSTEARLVVLDDGEVEALEVREPLLRRERLEWKIEADGEPHVLVIVEPQLCRRLLTALGRIRQSWSSRRG